VSSTTCRVVVPATSANLGPGFDAFGLALGLYDEVKVELIPAGLSIDVEGEGANEVPRDKRHLVVRALQATFDRLGEQPPGLALTCRNRIPHGRGLGSSAAAIVAGVLAARALAREGEAQLDDQATLDLAAGLEGHPDNVAACLRGGLTVAWSGGGRYRATRVEVGSFDVVAYVPSTAVATELARGLLPAGVSHEDAAINAGRAGLLVAALAGDSAEPVDLDLLYAATEDRLHQRYRAPAMPGSFALVEELRERAIPAVISGAGPTVLAFTERGRGERLAASAPGGFVARVLPVDRQGAHACRE
jgi:homoserine kinase